MHQYLGYIGPNDPKAGKGDSVHDFQQKHQPFGGWRQQDTHRLVSVIEVTFIHG
jgi:hypothetical protein